MIQNIAMDISRKDLVKEVRCLRMHLAPALSEHFKNVLEAVELRLLPGEIETLPVKAPVKRITKKDRMVKYLNKTWP